ncbi:MAG: hypothetical protein JXB07_00760 [Anaerolineae bacterium]|nr:hypothetical protein [Anaerolineae bacterium]
MSNYDLFGDYEPEQPATLEEDRPELEPDRQSSPRPRRKRSGKGGGFYNFVSLLFLAATIGVCILAVLLIQNPMLPFNPFPPVAPYPTPTLFLVNRGENVGSLSLPTSTPTTASTRVPTTLPRGTELPDAATPTLDLLEGTESPTTLQPAATNTISIEPFTLQNEAVTYTQHTSGCSGLWVVGQVFDMEQKPLKGLAVIARWESNSALGWSGYATQWGESGYEITINNKPVEIEVEIQLLAGTGQALSEPVVVRTLDTCDRNVAIANFIQNHPFSP